MSHDESMSGLDFRDFLTIGSFVVTCMLLGLGAGWWVDARLGTTPVLTLVGLTVGVAAGVTGTWFRIRPLLIDGSAHSGARQGPPPGTTNGAHRPSTGQVDREGPG
jgi:hypothetical protein